MVTAHLDEKPVRVLPSLARSTQDSYREKDNVRYCAGLRKRYMN